VGEPEVEISIENSIRLDGQVVIVTGGTQGAGRGIANAYLAAGAKVVVCARRDPQSLPEVDGNVAEFYSLDVGDLEAINVFMAHVSTTYGRLDVLVNNAGGAPFADAATASPRFSEKIIKLNLLAPLNLAQAANKIMREQDSGGVILNIASVSALRPSPGTAAYGAAKAGLVSLTQSLAVEWAPKVRMNAIAAGPILTEQAAMHFGDQAGIDAVHKTIPLQRMALPADMGHLCVMLSSPYGAYLNGACIEGHGGGERPAFLDAANVN